MPPPLLVAGGVNVWLPELVNGLPAMLVNVPFAGSYQRAVVEPAI